MAVNQRVEPSTRSLKPAANHIGRQHASGRAPTRVACERCHGFKQKCHFDYDLSKCSNCHRLGKPCRSRTKKRMGRKPVVKDFPHGSHSLITLTLNNLQPESQCRSDRSVRRKSISSSAWRPNIIPLSPVPYHDREVGSVLTSKESFFYAHRHFMVGKSFNNDFYRITLLVFNYSPQILSDAYHALLELTNGPKAPDLRLDSLDLSFGARGLRSLVNVQSSIIRVEDAAAAIALGQILLAYNALLPLGSSTRTITRASLLGVKDWYPSMYQRPELDVLTIIPVLVDTIDCLVRREVPVVQLPTTERCIVDRSCGICPSLLPLLYDLCVCSHRAKMDSQISTSDRSNDLDPYLDIERKIMAWTPLITPDFYSRYEPSEIMIMLTQACSYRTAALLIIHRLRFALGTEDTTGIRHAESILHDLSPLLSCSSDGPTGLGLDFPLFVTMVEIPGLGTEIFKAFEPLRYRKRQGEDMLEFAGRIQEARRLGYEGLWFDLVEGGFRGDFMP